MSPLLLFGGSQPRLYMRKDSNMEDIVIKATIRFSQGNYVSADELHHRQLRHPHRLRGHYAQRSRLPAALARVAHVHGAGRGLGVEVAGLRDAGGEGHFCC